MSPCHSAGNCGMAYYFATTMTTFLSNRSISDSVICGIVPEVRERLWIATADIKDIANLGN